MAHWTDRRLAALARNKPSITSSHDIKVAEVGYRNMRDGGSSELDGLPDLVGGPSLDSVSKVEKQKPKKKPEVSEKSDTSKKEDDTNEKKEK